jgi:hypothetical protein
VCEPFFFFFFFRFHVHQSLHFSIEKKKREKKKKQGPSFLFPISSPLKATPTDDFHAILI